MKRFQYSKAHNLTALHDELLAAVPAVRPVAGPDGRNEAVMTLSGNGTDVELWVPDDVTKAQVDAVVNAHTNPPPPDMTPPDFGNDTADMGDYPALRSAVGDLRQYLGVASPTAAQSTAALKLLTRLVLAMVRRMV